MRVIRYVCNVQLDMCFSITVVQQPALMDITILMESAPVVPQDVPHVRVQSFVKVVHMGIIYI